MKASFREYRPSSFTSRILYIVFGSINGLTQSSKLRSPRHRLLSMARRPVMSSNNTIPKLYTSHFVVSLHVHIGDLLHTSVMSLYIFYPFHVKEIDKARGNELKRTCS